jgi:hypothetical protein
VVKFPLNLIFTAGLLQIFENTENPSPSLKWGFQSPKFSDSDFREVRGLGLGRPKSSAVKGDTAASFYLHRKMQVIGLLMFPYLCDHLLNLCKGRRIC